MNASVGVRFSILLLLSEIVGLCLCVNSNVGCLEQERKALLKFKATLIDPSHRLSSWNSNINDCCHWNSVTCDIVTGHVLKLDLKNPCYSSSECDFGQQSLEASQVDQSLVQLEYLSYLDLSGNQLHASPIPLFFASMHNLRNLYLSNANFSGRIPYNLGNLTNLVHIDLSLNDFQVNDMNWVSGLHSLQSLNLLSVDLGKAHDVFQVFYKLPSLSHLNLAECEIPSLIPPLHNSPNFTHIPKIQVLDLTYNSLETRSLDVFQNMTSSVRVLSLSFNNLSSLPLWFSKFDNLEELNVVYNRLHGPLPPALRNLSSIRVLDLSSNNLTSSVPSWLGELTTLHQLSLSSNNFTSLESSLFLILKNMCHLKELDFSTNNFHGKAFGSFEKSGCVKYDLEQLNLRFTTFEDYLPSWLGELENLKELYISESTFFGPIPSSLGKLSQLTKLELVNNHLNGTIPESLAQLVNLTFLRLAGNQLEGFIPTSLSQLVNLNILDLSYNHLRGSIPPSFGHLVNMHYLGLANNDLHGDIPDNFGQLVNLVELDLSFNSLRGSISTFRGWSFEQLTILNLFGNKISGSLPENIDETMPVLQYLLLGNNSMNGSIPNSLCKIVTLIRLDLSRNELSGEIPDCWQDQGWDEINLSSNKLSGVIPTTFGNLSSLLWLHLNNNSLHGELPQYLVNLKELVIMDVGENQFFGSIPPWNGDTFPMLQILRLRENKLNGRIPPQLCQLASLQILDLASNNLTGSIPHCIGNFSGMIKSNSSNEAKVKFDSNFFTTNFIDEWPTQDVKQVVKGTELDYIKILKFVVNMDLSDNNLVGFVPKGITQLTRLHGLNLSHNHLKGEIPARIGDLKSLESFDISRNNFSGRIPETMSSLTALSHLNLSYNNLSGPIPTENQFLTLGDQQIYAGNPHLCGVPLPNKCAGGDLDDHNVHDDGDDDDDSEKVWFYFVVAIGFAVGFWSAIGTLLLKKNWRYAVFRRVDDVADEIYVTMALKVAKLKRVIRGNHVHV